MEFRAKSGYRIVIDSHGYADEYHFMGRLHKPILTLYNKEKHKEYMQKHKKVAIITYKDRKVKFDKKLIITSTKYRTKNAILIYDKNWFKWLNSIKR